MKEILFSILSGNHNPAIKVPTALAVIVLMLSLSIFLVFVHHLMMMKEHLA